MSSPPRMVICGGGAIGAAIAYFTSRRGARPTVIERHAVAGAASGKSGGFLALDWCRGSSLDALARRSFKLHAELSAELGNSWGYRRLTTYGGYAAGDENSGRGGRGPRPAGPGRAYERPRLPANGAPGRAARVHERSDAGRAGVWRGAAARHGRRRGAESERSSARRRTGERGDRRWRRRRHRHGAVVGPGGALAAAAGCFWLQGPQFGVR